MKESIYENNRILLFIFVCLTSILLIWIKQYFIEFETTAFEFLQDRPEGLFFKLLRNIQLASIPIIFLWKFTVVGFVLWIGCFAFGYRVTYSQCWTIALVAEFVSFAPAIIEIIWFLTIKTDASLHEVINFYPLSLTSFFDSATINNTRFAYPLRALSLFELLYIFVLVDGVYYYSRSSRKIVWQIITFSYLLLFFLWLIFYMIVY